MRQELRCSMQETTVCTYRVSLPPTEWAKTAETRHAAGALRTRLVKIPRFCRRRHWPWLTEAQLKVHFKRRFPLHSQTVQALIEKFCATIDGVHFKTTERRQTHPLSLAVPPVL